MDCAKKVYSPADLEGHSNSAVRVAGCHAALVLAGAVSTRPGTTA